MQNSHQKQVSQTNIKSESANETTAVTELKTMINHGDYSKRNWSITTIYCDINKRKNKQL